MSESDKSKSPIIKKKGILQTIAENMSSRYITKSPEEFKYQPYSGPAGTLPEIPNKEIKFHSPDGTPPPIYDPHSPALTPPPNYNPQSPDLTPPPLDNSLPKTPSLDNSLPKTPPLDNSKIQEKEEEEEKEYKRISQHVPPSKQFEILVDKYYTSQLQYNNEKSNELEVRFGTGQNKILTKNDYDNVIKKLKYLKFSCNDEIGIYTLKMQHEYNETIGKRGGENILSSIRTEISGLHNIQLFCNTNDLKKIDINYIQFTDKKAVFIDDKKVYPVYFDDFNFKVSFQLEKSINMGVKKEIIDNWTKTKKTFRYLNRVSFIHEDYPIKVDISIVKSSNKEGYGLKKSYTTTESNVFNNQETYEIELEVINNKIGNGTKFNSSKLVLDSIKSVIKIILSGLQGTNYPISYLKQDNILKSYMYLIYKDKEKKIELNNFIGPSSLTLQIENICEIDHTLNIIPNIRNNYTVTEKADGERRLMYINEIGEIYLLSSSMNVIFTGAKTLNKDCFNSLLDGELISNDKFGEFINLFAAFDLYFYNNKNVRSYPFIFQEKEEDLNKSRYYLLKKIINELHPVSINKIIEKEEKISFSNILKKFKKDKDLISPIRIKCKNFYPETINETTNIFKSCKNVLDQQSTFEYNTDGLIFTPAYFGVGSNKIGIEGPLFKITWDHSFKWKPPEYNTIDFLVNTIKGSNNEDIIKSIISDSKINEYKTIQLKCGFNQQKHGYINPCQDIIDDKLPEYKPFNIKKMNDLIPVQFYPTKPYDPNAGICNIILSKDGSNTNQMFTEEGDVFIDNTIVEFSYKLDNETGWNWNPLRVRYDKTSEFRQGIKNYGNAYHVANSNWQSIHNPITLDMISLGINIPDLLIDQDIYFNKPSGNLETNSLKDFHNLYVKKLLIKKVSKHNDTLIDYACGKAGDLPKWIDSNLSFVFGIDISKDNLENKLDGACARFLNLYQQKRNIPYALFVNGNCALNIKNGSAMLNDKAIQITKAIFGNGTKNEEQLGKGVLRQYGVAEEGFNISSCQFALHYFFENPETLHEFLKNISECTKLNGYFIGTAYDGKTLFNLLKKKQIGESIEIKKEGKKIWEVIKGYNLDTFDDNSGSIGYRIDVFQESINQYISEYLINFDYLNRILQLYGFKLISKEEANLLNLPDNTGLFNDLFNNMESEIKINNFKDRNYSSAVNMSEQEKKISFLNRYFIYTKINNVDITKIVIDLEDYNQKDILTNEIDTKEAIEIGKEEIKKFKPKIRKLNRKLLLIPATEAIDEITSTSSNKAITIADINWGTSSNEEEKEAKEKEAKEKEAKEKEAKEKEDKEKEAKEKEEKEKEDKEEKEAKEKEAKEKEAKEEKEKEDKKSKKKTTLKVKPIIEKEKKEKKEKKKIIIED